MVRNDASPRIRWSMNTASRKPSTRRPGENSTPKMTMFSTETIEPVVREQAVILAQADAVELRQQLASW